MRPFIGSESETAGCIEGECPVEGDGSSSGEPDSETSTSTSVAQHVSSTTSARPGSPELAAFPLDPPPPLFLPDSADVGETLTDEEVWNRLPLYITPCH